ncbi:MAG: hypothetical protein AB7G12_05125 [Thermoanaerobaculia bacterium]
MSVRNYERGLAWSGLVLAAAAALGFALVARASAAGEVREKQSRVELKLDQDGAIERIVLEGLHEMAVGETRTVSSESGTPVYVTRDENGFEVELNGKKVRVVDHFSGEDLGNGTRFFRHEIHDGEGEDGEAHAFVFHTGDGEARDVTFLRESGDLGEGFAWATDGAELVIPFGVEGTISRLNQNAGFLELDEATRAKVIAALREVSPHRLRVEASPDGSNRKRRVMVIESQGDNE